MNILKNIQNNNLLTFSQILDDNNQINWTDFSTNSFTTEAEILNAIDNNFKYLNKVLAESQKKIEYLDLYKIQRYINADNVTEIGSLFADLLNNTCLGVGVGELFFGSDIFYKGDLLLKTNTGELEHISAPSSGIYAPTLLKAGEQNNTSTSPIVQWTYFHDSMPVESSADNSQALTEYKYEVKDFNKTAILYDSKWILTPDSENQPIIDTSNNTISYSGLNIQKTTIGVIEHPIYPVIKCYNKNGEEVYTDIVLTINEKDTTKWNITLPLNSTIYQQDLDNLICEVVFK